MPKPTEVRYIEASGALVIAYDDGRSFEYPARLLRSWCPCAKCQGHFATRRARPVERPEQARIEDVTPVGGYALCVHWGDGHDTGIYTFRDLIEMGERIERGELS